MSEMLNQIVERQKSITAEVNALKEQGEILITLLANTSSDDLKTRMEIKDEMEAIAHKLGGKLHELDENARHIRMLRNA